MPTAARGRCAAIKASVSQDNSSGSADGIQFDPSLDGSTITLTTSENDLTPGSKMAGPSAFFITNNDVLSIDGVTGLTRGITIAAAATASNAFRIFDVDAGATLALFNLTLSGGIASGFKGGDTYGPSGAGGGSAGMGGAIFNRGGLQIYDRTLTDNVARGGDGGDTTTARTASQANGGASGAGGAGLGAPGGTGLDDRSGPLSGGAGGGPNGGAGSIFGAITDTLAQVGGFGGGGGAASMRPRPRVARRAGSAGAAGARI